MPTVTVMPGKERAEKPPLLPTLRRAALASARKTICYLKAIIQPVQIKMLVVWPQTLLLGVYIN